MPRKNSGKVVLDVHPEQLLDVRVRRHARVRAIDTPVREIERLLGRDAPLRAPSWQQLRARVRAEFVAPCLLSRSRRIVVVADCDGRLWSCSVLQCVGCSVLVAVCCGVLQCVVVCYSGSQCVVVCTVCCSSLQCIAVCCSSVLQCTCCSSVLQ